MNTNDNQTPIRRELDGAAYLRHLRERAGMTQREFGNRLGLRRPNFISMVESGDSKFPSEHWPVAAKVLGVDPKMFGRRMVNAYYPGIHDVLF